MPKLLVEFLQEKQEPFALDVFLVERGYSIKKRRGAIRKCSKLVKAVFGRLVLHNNQGIKNRRNNEDEDEDEDEHVFSTASDTTIYNSCSESDVEDAHFSEVDAERELKWRSMEDSNNNKQLSPISVLEETDQTDEGPSPLHQKQYNSTRQESEESNSCYVINKRAMQQSKKLLVDCVREVIEKQEDAMGEKLKKILSSDELWKLVCENVWIWSQHSIDGTNILQLLQSDFMASQKQWACDLDEQTNEVCNEIADAILDSIINDIV